MVYVPVKGTAVLIVPPSLKSSIPVVTLPAPSEVSTPPAANGLPLSKSAPAIVNAKGPETDALLNGPVWRNASPPRMETLFIPTIFK